MGAAARFAFLSNMQELVVGPHSPETCARVTASGLPPVPAVPVQALCAHVTKCIQLADSGTIVCNGKYGGSENLRAQWLSSDPAAHHCSSLLSLLHCRKDGVQHMPLSGVK